MPIQNLFSLFGGGPRRAAETALHETQREQARTVARNVAAGSMRCGANPLAQSRALNEAMANERQNQAALRAQMRAAGQLGEERDITAAIGELFNVAGQVAPMLMTGGASAAPQAALAAKGLLGGGAKGGMPGAAVQQLVGAGGGGGAQQPLGPPGGRGLGTPEQVGAAVGPLGDPRPPRRSWPGVAGSGEVPLGFNQRSQVTQMSPPGPQAAGALAAPAPPPAAPTPRPMPPSARALSGSWAAHPAASLPDAGPTPRYFEDLNQPYSLQWRPR